MKNLYRRIAVASGSVAAMVATGAANAAGGPDFTTITSSVDASTAIAAIVAMGIVIAGPGFAKWATKKVAGFFG
ncbi:hypothetical protein ACUXAV_002853 [Cupriavidus metallidurans]|uniref:hypothetical protein n=1 Tax=Cupriavidus metallidurans TaxID=119219 RepID=UPI00049384AF|nr:hypothetical protein [Cupriavidus metallidurans]AVA32825.1 hypothetical protein C3Z06_03840 [Cupriavidus metallidurans]MDE4916999.1 hypothetical protein [Cupriavidus metallidurans]MDE4919811.1 hypothetical protein [Cupriavidus metallidurans]